ncbi:MAG: hypothetical protein OEW75_07190 [Cyclobacteriaceae bacterium]|nr:hypothetical protein [Cyclobacteriaceae bacterium]
MAIPGFNFFSRKINYQRFHFEPRYYDPVKEELKERERQIKQELNMSTEERTYRSNLRGSFKRIPVKRDKAGFIRLLLVVFMITGLVLYVNFGQIAVYFLFIPVLIIYLIIKFKLI